MYNVYIYIYVLCSMFIYIYIYQLDHGTHDLSIFFLDSFPEMIGALGIASEVSVFGSDRDAKHILRYSQEVCGSKLGNGKCPWVRRDN